VRLHEHGLVEATARHRACHGALAVHARGTRAQIAGSGQRGLPLVRPRGTGGALDADPGVAAVLECVRGAQNRGRAAASHRL
jgi:hypothetical protein